MKNPGVIYEMSKDEFYRVIILFIYVGFGLIIQFCNVLFKTTAVTFKQYWSYIQL